MLVFVPVAGVVLLIGVIMLVSRPSYVAAVVCALGAASLSLVGDGSEPITAQVFSGAALVGALTFAVLGGFIFLFGNPFKKRSD